MGWQYQEAEVYKPKKREPMPKYHYEAARASFKFSSLFTRPEVIESLGTVDMISELFVTKILVTLRVWHF